MNTAPKFTETLKNLSESDLLSLYDHIYQARVLMEKAIPQEAYDSRHWVSPELNAIFSIEGDISIERFSRSKNSAQ